MDACTRCRHHIQCGHFHSPVRIQNPHPYTQTLYRKGKKKRLALDSPRIRRWSPPLPERVAQLKEMALFRGLSEEQLEQIAARLHDHTLPANQLLYGAGERAENFYILVSGQLLNQEIHAGQRVGEYLLEPGDPFGAESLLAGTDRQAAVSALRPSQLLYLTGRDFQWMLAEFPQVAGSLRHLLSGRELLAQVEFDWLEENKVVYYVARKPPRCLCLRLARSVVVAIFAMLI